MAYEKRPQGDRPPMTWSDLQLFTADDTDFAVKVQVSDSPRPQYSMEIGRMRDGKFLRFLRPIYTTENGQVHLRPLDAVALGRLFVRAEALIETRMQARENEWQEQRRSREVWQAQDQEPPRRTSRKKRDDGRRERRRHQDY